MKERVAIITGGGRGIGKAISLGFAKLGANLVINYASNSESALETKKECESMGVKVLLIQADVADSNDCKKIVDETMKEFGRVDILVNNAGITRDGLSMRMSDEDFDRVLKTNLYGAFYMMREVARPMMKQRYGRIINLSSVSALLGTAGQINYSSSKAGLIAMTKTFAREVATRGITVNAVAPGYIETDMTNKLDHSQIDNIVKTIPMARKGCVEDVARTILFLADEKSSYITGETIRVDGGLAI